jgi:hypothetical protein
MMSGSVPVSSTSRWPITAWGAASINAWGATSRYTNCVWGATSRTVCTYGCNTFLKVNPSLNMYPKVNLSINIIPSRVSGYQPQVPTSRSRSTPVSVFTSRLSTSRSILESRLSTTSRSIICSRYGNCTFQLSILSSIRLWISVSSTCYGSIPRNEHSVGSITGSTGVAAKYTVVPQAGQPVVSGPPQQPQPVQSNVQTSVTSVVTQPPIAPSTPSQTAAATTATHLPHLLLEYRQLRFLLSL